MLCKIPFTVSDEKCVPAFGNYLNKSELRILANLFLPLPTIILKMQFYGAKRTTGI